MTDAEYISRAATIRRELRLAIAQAETACWALEKICALPPGVREKIDPSRGVNDPIRAAQKHLEAAISQD